MNKNFQRIFIALALVGCVSMISSCGKTEETAEDIVTPAPTPNPNPDPTPGPDDPTPPSGNDAMTPLAQKQKLEAVGLELKNCIPVSDFQAIADYGNYCAEVYGKYSWENVEAWAKQIYKDCTSVIGDTDIKEDLDPSGSIMYRTITTDYRIVILLSNYKGRFTVKNSKWIRNTAQDLSFVFKATNGEDCILKLATSGAEKMVHIYDDGGFDKTSNSYNGYMYYVSNYYVNDHYTIGIPEKVELTMSKGTETLVKLTLNCDLSNITDEEFDLAESGIDMTMTTEFNNGYKVAVSQASYKGNNAASASAFISKNDKTLLSAAFASEISGLPNCNLSEAKNFEWSEKNLQNANGKLTFAKIDVLGKVQVQATLSDAHALVNAMNNAMENDTKESDFKSYINQANSLFTADLFYDGKNVKQASVSLEPFRDERYDGSKYWYAEPVVNFYDGSSYQVMSAFFNEGDFKKLIDAFSSLISDYERLIQ